MQPAMQTSKITGNLKSREIRKDISFSSHSEDSQTQGFRADKPPSHPQHDNNKHDISNQKRQRSIPASHSSFESQGTGVNTCSSDRSIGNLSCYNL